MAGGANPVLQGTSIESARLTPIAHAQICDATQECARNEISLMTGVVPLTSSTAKALFSCREIQALKSMLCTSIWAGATGVSARKPLVSITEIVPSGSIVYSASGSPSFDTRSQVPSTLNFTASVRESTVTLLRKVGSGIGQVVKLNKPRFGLDLVLNRNGKQFPEDGNTLQGLEATLRTCNGDGR